MDNNKCFSANLIDRLNTQLFRLTLKNKGLVLNKEIFLNTLNDIFIKSEIDIKDANKIADDIYNSDSTKKLISEFNLPSKVEIIESINNSSVTLSKNDESFEKMIVTTDEDSVEDITENNLLKISNTDRESFYKVVRDRLINLSFINKYSNELNIWDKDINKSFISLKNELASNLRDFLKTKGKNPSNSVIFTETTNHAELNALLKDFNTYFFSKVDGSVNLNSSDKEIVYDYLLLSNFDEVIYQHPDLKSVIGISTFLNSENNFNKYTFNFGLQKNVDFSDNLENIESYTNKIVKYYIESIKSSDNRNTLKFNDFNGMINHLKSLNYFDYTKLDALNTDGGISNIFNIIYNTMNSGKNYDLFSGKNSQYKNVFLSIYENIFNEKNDSSLITLTKKLSPDLLNINKNNLFNMIVNHINKTTPINYVTTFYNKENNRYETVELETANLKNIIFNVKSNLTANINEDFLKNINKYKVYVDELGGKYSKINFFINDDKFSVDFNDYTEIYLNDKLIDKATFANVLRDNSDKFSELFRDILYSNYITDEFVDILLSSFSGRSSELIPVIASILTSNIIINATHEKKIVDKISYI